MAKMKAEAVSHISDKPKDKQEEKEPARAHDRMVVVHQISLRVEGTAEQLGALGEYLERSGLRYTME